MYDVPHVTFHGESHGLTLSLSLNLPTNTSHWACRGVFHGVQSSWRKTMTPTFANRAVPH